MDSVKDGLEKYCAIQQRVHASDISQDTAFQRLFVAFYRIRRNAEWRFHYFRFLEGVKHEGVAFADALAHLHQKTGRLEASFASKLVATVHPDKPVIDSIVLCNLRLSLPRYGAAERVAGVRDTYQDLCTRFQELLDSEEGQNICHRFDRLYGERGLTQVKKLDLFLWQLRDGIPKGRKVGK